MAPPIATFRGALDLPNRSRIINGCARRFVTCSRALAAAPQDNHPPDADPSQSSTKTPKRSYPHYPSVAQLLRQKDIPTSEADKIPATGPKGRLLKGDVLAYVGTISASYPSEQSARISKLGSLDLSNIQPAAPKPAEPSAPATPTAEALEANRLLVNALFDQILGIPTPKPKPPPPSLTLPAAPSPPPSFPPPFAIPAREPDIIDLLTARHPPASSI